MKPIQIISPGTIISGDHPEWLRLQMEVLSRHVLIAGGTGKGKTKLLEQFMRQFTSYGWGWTLVTPHPDAREAMFHYFAVMGVDPRRVLDMKPEPSCCIGIDPYARPPPDCNPLEYEAWLRATGARVVSGFLRGVPLADQQVMVLLKRWLKNVLYCCGKNVDGQHLGIDKALILLEPDHPDHDFLMDRLWPHLPGDIRFDFNTLKAIKSVGQRSQVIGSTVNRLREVVFDNPLTTQMFSPKAPSIDYEDTILNSKMLMVSVPETDFMSRDQGNVVAGLVISGLIGAAKRLADRLPEEKRVPHMLIIDEAENFVGEEIRTGFQELRKFKVSIIFTVQDLSCLKPAE